ncbi:LUD domain-containing protein [Corynebacterium sp.]|uniref:LutC/YkgG family protein n=1 Tax=Corynebacterium sp. TaxID=1720 RepID=UPI0025BCA4A3|nr:LUD domain-containing protein [Corynebacterium sp.]
MSDTSDARTEVLARIRSSLGLRKGENSTLPAGETTAIPRDYRRSGDLTGDALVDLLVDRLEDYDATVRRVADTDAAIAGAVASYLADRGHGGDGNTVVSPADVDARWLGSFEDAGGEVLQDSTTAPLAVADLDRVDAVVTASFCSVAESGTILLAGPGSGRRATTLVPDHHIVVVKVADIVELLPEAVTRLTDAGLHTSPVTMVAGPSASVDIELVRVQGVHGPRTLDVVLAG